MIEDEGRGESSPNTGPDSGPDTETRPRWERRKDARPQELLAAALGLFVERGFAATRLDDVAAAAGVSKGTVYLYFANKEDLFKAVVREHLLPVLAEGQDLIDGFAGSTPDLLRLLVRSWWQRVGDSPVSGLAKLVMAESGNFPDIARFYSDEVIARADSLMIRVIERGVRSGEFRPVDPQMTNLVLIAPLIFLMMWRQSFGACTRQDIDPIHYLDCFLDLALNGLNAAKPT